MMQALLVRSWISASQGQPALACYRVLDRAGDARTGEALQRAWVRLQHLADTIADVTARRRFLLGVPAHRELVGLVGVHT